MKKLLDLTTLPIGTKVWSPLYGIGKFAHIDKHNMQPIVIEFDMGIARRFTRLGCYYATLQEFPILAPSKDAYIKNPENPWEDYKTSIKDKQLIWCWDDTYLCIRHLKFYDAVNHCVFSVDGKRNSSKYNNYEPYKGEYPEWAKEALKLLEI